MARETKALLRAALDAQTNITRSLRAKLDEMEARYNEELSDRVRAEDHSVELRKMLRVEEERNQCARERLQAVVAHLAAQLGDPYIVVSRAPSDVGYNTFTATDRSGRVVSRKSLDDIPAARE